MILVVVVGSSEWAALMQVEIRHNPSLSVARLTLAPGEPAQVESGAMAALGLGPPRS